MALTQFEYDMEIIQKLDDEPNDVGGLTAAQLKAKFDEGGMAVKKFLNETLLSELDSDFALKSELDGIVAGVSPDLARAEEVLSEM